jgi:NADPH-dependent glutamate synthase beta subunit-like oxidoreductase
MLSKNANIALLGINLFEEHESDTRFIRIDVCFDDLCGDIQALDFLTMIAKTDMGNRGFFGFPIGIDQCVCLSSGTDAGDRIRKRLAQRCDKVHPETWRDHSVNNERRRKPQNEIQDGLHTFSGSAKWNFPRCQFHDTDEFSIPEFGFRRHIRNPQYVLSCAFR